MRTQRSIAGKTTGSFINYMMGNNSTLPEVGKGCTLLSWTDRHAYEVMEVSKDSKRVVIQQYLPERADKNGMSECQDYKYIKLNGIDEVIVWKWNAWRKESKVIMFTKDYSKTIGINSMKDADHKALYNEDGDLTLVEGKTEMVTKYSKVNILWGVKDIAFNLYTMHTPEDILIKDVYSLRDDDDNSHAAVRISAAIHACHLFAKETLQKELVDILSHIQGLNEDEIYTYINNRATIYLTIPKE